MTTPPPSAESLAAQRAIVHYTSLCAVVLCPILIALPPRKFDIYTIAALASTGLGGNQLVREYTGRSVVERMQAAGRRMTAQQQEGGLPTRRAEEVRALLRAERASRGGNGVPEGAAGGGKEPEGVLEALDKEKGGKSEWKRKRDEHERKALREGKGYADLIVEQIWDVWSWGKGGAEEVRKAEGRVVGTVTGKVAGKVAEKAAEKVVETVRKERGEEREAGVADEGVEGEGK